jgi:ferrochelatase
MNERSGPWGRAYLGQHRSAATVVAERVRQEVARKHPSRLVFCSRSGPPNMPWLEPDVNDHLEELAKDGASSAVIVPIGFVSDHMEVIYDLDTEALATAERLSFPVSRAATPGIDPRFVGLPRELLVERAATERGEEVPRVAVGGLMAAPDLCAAGCCPNLRGEQPVIGGPQAPPKLVT